MKSARLFIISVLIICFAVTVSFYFVDRSEGQILSPVSQMKSNTFVKKPELPTKSPSPTAQVTPTLTPSPKPITLEDMNKKYGPCAKVNVLMYHHIEETAIAKSRGQSGLAVSPENFKNHMEYLKVKGYAVIGSEELVGFLNGQNKLPTKAVMITFDDAYEDNYRLMWPILKEYGYKAIIFTPTGLVNNPDYMSWSQIKEMASSVYFGNHTWSHHSSSGGIDVQKKEISLADGQLSENRLNKLKVFAYPYGNPSNNAQTVLKDYGYNLAFTTKYGNIMCQGLRYELPRIRVGNAPLSNFGL